MTYNVLFIVGATASGKSATAIDIARRYNGVIINADSMQIYKGLEIITASPDVQDKQTVPHMLYNHIPMGDSFDVIQWRNSAVNAIQSVLKMGKLPIICGGTGFYASAFLSGLSPIPTVDTDIRNTVRQLQEQEQANPQDCSLMDLLTAEDPVMAQKVLPTDTQRIARALEIIRSTGNSLSYYQSLPKDTVPDTLKTGVVFVSRDRADIYDSINARFDSMVESGALAEVQNMVRAGIPDTSQSAKAIGVRELYQYEKGTLSYAQAIESAKTSSRRYAKRQMTYIRTQLHPDYEQCNTSMDGLYNWIDKHFTLNKA